MRQSEAQHFFMELHSKSWMNYNKLYRRLRVDYVLHNGECGRELFGFYEMLKRLNKGFLSSRKYCIENIII